MSDEDLAWNRRGQLGPGQRREVESHLASFGASRYAAQLGEYVNRWERDLAEGRVVAVDGVLVFDYQGLRDASRALPPSNRPNPGQTAYVATLPGQERAQLAPWFELPPGPYRFYLAPRARFVVAAEPTSPPEVYRAALHDLLRAAQNIDEETLAANRSGRMTDAQRAALGSWRGDNDLVASFALLAGVAFACHALLAFKKLAVTGSLRALSRDEIIPLVVAVAALLGVVVSAVHRRNKLAGAQEDLREGRALAIEGPCKKDLSIHRYGRVSKSVHIGDRVFDLSRRGELFAALVEGPIYRAYLAPRSGRLLSIEPARLHFSSRSG